MERYEQERRNNDVVASQRKEQLLKSTGRNDEHGRELFIFGHYPTQDDKIEWIKIKQERNKILLLSSKILDAKSYNKSVYGDGFEVEDNDFLDYYRKNEIVCREFWKKSDLYKWLNTDFLDNTFSKEEQNALVDVGDGKVFCLSVEEAKESFVANNFDVWGYYAKLLQGYRGLEDYNTITPLAQAQGIEYAIDNGLYVNDGIYEQIMIKEYKNFSSWWLRSPGTSSCCAAFVYNDGGVHVGGDHLDYSDIGVRPALWLKMVTS
ncbi:MAG: DUF6273 domain-containing protein [Firmicutes bacterium]|nr:DUF6273 domain-containing protein [Bacillota bacterium]MCL1954051.1 DUF6273 domain-containing protein [Bacillota bacterium]